MDLHQAPCYCVIKFDKMFWQFLMFKLQSNLPLWNLVCLYCLHVTSCRGLYLDYSRLDYRASGTLPVMLVWWMWHEAILWSTHKTCHKLYNYELKLCQHYWQLFVVKFLISRCPCLPFNFKLDCQTFVCRTLEQQWNLNQYKWWNWGERTYTQHSCSS